MNCEQQQREPRVSAWLILLALLALLLAGCARTTVTVVLPTATSTPTTPCTPSPGISPVSPVEVARGNTSQPRIALTFDAGADAGPAPRLLSILAAHHVHATWFMTGEFAAANPDIVRQVRDAGHEIANHTVHHLDLTTLSDTQVCNELVQADITISQITGKTTRPYFRPPFGARNANVRQLAANLGYRDIYWTIDTLDWETNATTDSIRSRVLNNVGNGSIILMHVGSYVEADTLDGLMTTLEQRGYSMVTVSEVL